MITAIPLNDNRLANHFTKASRILFVNQNGIINQLVNPALQDGCANKKQMLNLLLQNNIQRIIVRNIGQRLLGKLLAKNIIVLQASSGRHTIDELIKSDDSHFRRLTSIEEGRPSIHHGNKEHSCCGHDDHSSSPKIPFVASLSPLKGPVIKLPPRS